MSSRVPQTNRWMSYLSDNVLLDVEEPPASGQYFWCNQQGTEHADIRCGSQFILTAADVDHVEIGRRSSADCDCLHSGPELLQGAWTRLTLYITLTGWLPVLLTFEGFGCCSGEVGGSKVEGLGDMQTLTCDAKKRYSWGSLGKRVSPHHVSSNRPCYMFYNRRQRCRNETRIVEIALSICCRDVLESRFNRKILNLALLRSQCIALTGKWFHFRWTMPSFVVVVMSECAKKPGRRRQGIKLLGRSSVGTD